MELNHRFAVPAQIDETWRLLNDINRVGQCFPGAKVESTDGDDFSGNVTIKLGPISMQYKGMGTFVERDQKQYRAVIDATGKDKRGGGKANAVVTTQLTSDSIGTAIEVNTDLNITGKPAQFGRGVIQDVSDKLLDQFIHCLSNELSSAIDDTGAKEARPPTAESPRSAESHILPTGSSTDSATIDLGSTVTPILIKRYSPQIAAVTVLILALSWIRKRR